LARSGGRRDHCAPSPVHGAEATLRAQPAHGHRQQRDDRRAARREPGPPEAERGRGAALLCRGRVRGELEQARVQRAGHGRLRGGRTRGRALSSALPQDRARLRAAQDVSAQAGQDGGRLGHARAHSRLPAAPGIRRGARAQALPRPRGDARVGARPAGQRRAPARRGQAVAPHAEQGAQPAARRPLDAGTSAQPRRSRARAESAERVGGGEVPVGPGSRGRLCRRERRRTEGLESRTPAHLDRTGWSMESLLHCPDAAQSGVAREPTLHRTAAAAATGIRGERAALKGAGATRMAGSGARPATGAAQGGRLRGTGAALVLRAHVLRPGTQLRGGALQRASPGQPPRTGPRARHTRPLCRTHLDAETAVPRILPRQRTDPALLWTGTRTRIGRARPGLLPRLPLGETGRLSAHLSLDAAPRQPVLQRSRRGAHASYLRQAGAGARGHARVAATARRLCNRSETMGGTIRTRC